MLLFAAAGVAVLPVASASGGRAQGADPNSASSPYRVVEHWANLPEGRVWGQAIGVDIDRDGTSIWVFDRCGARTCEGSNLAPIQKFDASGQLVASLGTGMFEWPHGLFSASDGTVWVTDGKKQIVVQLAPDGRITSFGKIAARSLLRHPRLAQALEEPLVVCHPCRIVGQRQLLLSQLADRCGGDAGHR
jgi:hypothetical protein